MNNALKASMRAVPVRMLYAIGGTAAVAGAAIPLAVAAIGLAPFGVFVGYALVPFLVAFAAYVLLVVLRLRIVGFLPTTLRD